ncbi:hypothetical protein QJS10_CPB12g01228 [Acorus calamus]|uniref:SOSEKI DIX-like domain-containing protein n=1 Tax=Acorus calamus TaxID=4465 RepID=A0AAV9DLI4_ACOCL|nr:hypothetical protein QJS10_CPB12g01228 [Acorus calamus]
MEVGVRARRSRETSPERVKLYMQPKIKPFRKVKIVYYLCRNGQLEHPHFIEVSHLPNQQLRLKDVMDRLTILRGRGMPSLFSWSCKRTYKNGYVWNDLTENDVIHPTEGGAEYVLKGSEIIEGCSERFQQLQITQRPQNPEPVFKRKSNITLGGRNFPAEMEDEENDIDEFEEDEEEEEKPNHSCYNTPYSRCSRGVSTDEIETTHNNNNNNNNNKSSQNIQAEINLDSSSSSPPSSSSTASDKTHITNTDKTHEKSKRFEEEGDPAVPEPGSTSRNSVLLHLIACGSVAASKGKNAILSRPSPNNSGRKSAGSLHRGLLCRIANKAAEGGGIDGVDEEEINYMSENPRFGCPQLEEKEYFSGSIVEAMSNDSHRVAAEPCLKKSSSYNEERSLKSGIGKEVMEEEEAEKVEEKNVKGRCIPRKRFSVCKQTNKKQ